MLFGTIVMLTVTLTITTTIVTIDHHRDDVKYIDADDGDDAPDDFMMMMVMVLPTVDRTLNDYADSSPS